MKLVSESLKGIFKPKDQRDIDREINPIIKDFVNRISVEEFEDAFLNNPQYPISKKFILPNDNYIISTSAEELYNIIDQFTMELAIGTNIKTGEYLIKFPEFSKLWNNIFSNIHEKFRWRIVDKIYDAFTEKFHLEW